MVRLVIRVTLVARLINGKEFFVIRLKQSKLRAEVGIHSKGTDPRMMIYSPIYDEMIIIEL